MTRVDASDARKLSAGLLQAAAQAPVAAAKVVGNSAARATDQARAYARITAGAHGKWYPDAITWELVPSLSQIVAEFGPEAGLKQGSMGAGFEYGSINQTSPHLDNNRAADAEEPRFAVDLSAAVAGGLNL